MIIRKAGFTIASIHKLQPKRQPIMRNSIKTNIKLYSTSSKKIISVNQNYQFSSFNVATLNFSGINLNPFEYHDGSEDIQKICNFMKEFIQHQRKFEELKISAFDKIYTNNAMSVRFGSGVAETNHLLTRSQYIKKWKQLYQKNKPELPQTITEKQVNAVALFDYYCYLSVIRHLYNLQAKINQQIQNQNQIIKIYQIEGLEQIKSEKVREFLSAIHSRPASQISEKCRLAVNYLNRNKLDVFFVQECGLIRWEEYLKGQYEVAKGGDSVIIYKKERFGERDQVLTQKYKNILNFNNDTAFYFTKNNYLLLSIHLKSTPQHYKKQSTQMFQTLTHLLTEHPHLKILIGADTNHYIGTHPDNPLNYAPLTEHEYTSLKMRTYAQTQLKKARVEVKEAKDFIMSNLPIYGYEIVKVSGEGVRERDLLPSVEHPYDHFVVKARVGDLGGF